MNTILKHSGLIFTLLLTLNSFNLQAFKTTTGLTVNDESDTRYRLNGYQQITLQHPGGAGKYYQKTAGDIDDVSCDDQGVCTNTGSANILVEMTCTAIQNGKTKMRIYIYINGDYATGVYAQTGGADVGGASLALTTRLKTNDTIECRPGSKSDLFTGTTDKDKAGRRAYLTRL
jgi:hypothetical protein